MSHPETRSTSRRRRSRVLATCCAPWILLASCTLSPPPSGVHSTHSTPTLRQAISEIRSQYGLPAVAAAYVTLDGSSEIAVAGLSRRDTEVEVTEESLWHVGSVTKPMTATLAAILVEQGHLGWNATIGDVLSPQVEAIDPALRDVTLQQLLRHRAGIQAFEEDEEWGDVPALTGEPREQRAQFVAWLLARPPMHPPGQSHVYSNAGYSIAAAMLEAATGRTWEGLMSEELFAPLGIDDFAFGWPARSDPEQTWGHWLVGGELVVHDDLEGYRLAGQGVGPAGDVAVTMAGLARFAWLHLRGLSGEDDLLPAEAIRFLHSVDPPDEAEPYSVGWNSSPTRSAHLGSAGTFFAAIHIRKAAGVAWLIASNASTPDDSDYGRDLLIATRDRWRSAVKDSTTQVQRSP